MTAKATNYHVPAQSPWPIVAAVGLFVTVIGAANLIQQSTDKVKGNSAPPGELILLAGAAILIFMMFGWFRDTIKESLAGQNSAQLDQSYRLGMMWFIFSEVMFFGAFFGALFYIRFFAVPWLGGAGSNAMTHELLWPAFEATWPLTITPQAANTPGGETIQAMGPWGLPAINTLILLISSVTITISHHALINNDRKKQAVFLLATILLAVLFLGLQAYEYYEAYHHMGLTLGAGIYGSTFFMLTGFHGLHVTIGTIMLIVMLSRTLKGHLTPDNHFAFEATAWYWHFVDVVWLFLFVCVYWI